MTRAPAPGSPDRGPQRWEGGWRRMAARRPEPYPSHCPTRIIAIRAINDPVPDSDNRSPGHCPTLRRIAGRDRGVARPHPSQSSASESFLRIRVSPAQRSQSCASESVLCIRVIPAFPGRASGAGWGQGVEAGVRRTGPARVRVIPALPSNSCVSKGRCRGRVRRIGPGLRQTRAAPRPRVIGVAAVDVC